MTATRCSTKKSVTKTERRSSISTADRERVARPAHAPTSIHNVIVRSCSTNGRRVAARRTHHSRTSTGPASTWIITWPTSSSSASIWRSTAGSCSGSPGDRCSGATYAERHPDRVRALVLGAFSTGRASDIDWLTVHAGRFFPAEWHRFRDHVPTELRDLRLVDAYNILLMDPDPAVHEAAAIGVVPLGRRPRVDHARRQTESAIRRSQFPSRVSPVRSHTAGATTHGLSTTSS